MSQNNNLTVVTTAYLLMWTAWQNVASVRGGIAMASLRQEWVVIWLFT